MKLKSFEELFADELKDLYSAENQLVKNLPKLAKAASTQELRTAFEEHLQQTRGHAQRIEHICDQLEIKPKGKKCVGMEGLIEEGKELLSADTEDSVLEAGLIGAAQRVEHYEIAAYGTAAAHAKQLGHMEAAALLAQTLAEEKETDERLTQIAEAMVNPKAEYEGEGMKHEEQFARTTQDQGR
jgi:ferritin-like metal-binding protein YciE